MYHQPLVTTDVILYVASDTCSRVPTALIFLQTAGSLAWKLNESVQFNLKDMFI
jgi:hypothetical protein